MFIRLADKNDIPRILAIYAPYVEGTCTSFEYTVPTLAEFTARFETYTARFPWLVWEEQGQVLGYAYGSAPFSRAAYQWCCEMSIYLCPEAQGRGIGKKLYETLEAILFAQGFRRIYAVITSENGGSVAFHEKLGFRTVAVFPGCGVKFGKILGTVWMEKTAQSVDIPSEPPVPFPEIVKNARLFPWILDKLSLS